MTPEKRKRTSGILFIAAGAAFIGAGAAAHQTPFYGVGAAFIAIGAAYIGRSRKGP